MGFLTLGPGAGGAGPHAVAAAGLVNALENERSCSISRHAGRAELLLIVEEAEAGDKGLGGGQRDRVAGSGREGGEEDRPRRTSTVELLGRRDAGEN